MAAMTATGDLLETERTRLRRAANRGSFDRALARSPGNPEFHYGLALANARMGDAQEAARQLALAMKGSTSRNEHDLYAAKLDRLQSSLAH